MTKIKWRTACIIVLLWGSFFSTLAQIVPVGNGGYTTNFPGVDAAGRNGYPSGTPFTIGTAATKPTPTNDWWSHKVKNSHSSNLFNYPFTLKTVNNGLVVTYIPWGPIDNIEPVIVGVSGLNASAANVSDFSDWTVEMDWASANHHFTSTAGIGMPFLYFTKDSADVASITVNQGTVTITNEMLVIENARNGADFVVYAPVGSTWLANGATYTSTLNGKNYWSLAFLPLNASNIGTAANTFKKYAYVFPENTRADWSFNPTTSVVTTQFSVSTTVHEGNDSTMLLGLLPHHWANLAGSPSLAPHTFPTVRGELKTIEANAFTVQNTFYGILPTLPYVDYYSPTYSPSAMHTKIKLLENDALNSWTDSYNEGQEMNRLVQTARVAQLTGDSIALQKLLSTVKGRLENWLTASANEVAFIFYYNQTWSAMLGYPAGHGQDVNINDHHFHWGYFIHAAAFIEQFEPGWANQWGPMVNLLVRDAATADRADNLFPFLRNFSPYAGHCWANGFATFPQGNDQESTSESMQFNSSLIHWGAVTGNDSIRDLGIYLYTTEQSAVEEYWFDMYNRNFNPNHPYSLVSRVWGNSYDNGTFWTADIAASYGIELYPIHGGSLYLGQDTNYVKQVWSEIEQHTGILTNDPNVNLWHDIMWQYVSFVDPAKAIALYDSYPNRALKFGVSDVLTYHWLHAMNMLGNVSTAVTSNHPLAAAFTKQGDMTYVAQNYGNDTITVAFSDGFSLVVPPRKLITSKDIQISGTLSSSFLSAYPGGQVDLTVAVNGGVPSAVAFYSGDSLLGQVNQAPYTFTAANLPAGRHNFHARLYSGINYNLTNLVTVIVGDQLPYFGTPISLPGAFDAGHYDVFQGGIGNGIAYQDMTVKNEGNFRPVEYVDAQTVSGEGATVGWISPGEWLEFTVDVQQAGFYNLNFRYACGNTAGGGPMRIELDEQVVKAGISVAYTGGWSTWSTKSVTNVPLKSGTQVLRLYFDGGELNIGELTFAFASNFPFSQPIANAGTNQMLTAPQNSTALNGTGSQDPAGGTLHYKWSQVFGPSVAQISNDTIAAPQISALVQGVYLFTLEVDNGAYTDKDEVYIGLSANGNVAPSVSLFAPADQSVFIEGDPIALTAFAADLNDSVASVSFYVNGVNQAMVNQAPFISNWQPLPGNYVLRAMAKDYFGDSAFSAAVSVTVNPAPPCNGTSWNGDFSYVFSPDDNNPTLTFIPSQNGVGSPTCILYYSTDPGNMPGYIVSPNVPYTLNAKKGDVVYFYYTYSYPGAGERNNSANKISYVVGSCIPVGIGENALRDAVRCYPNPVTELLTIEFGEPNAAVTVFNSNGQLVDSFTADAMRIQYDMASFTSGLYIFQIEQNNSVTHVKVMK